MQGGAFCYVKPVRFYYGSRDGKGIYAGFPRMIHFLKT